MQIPKQIPGQLQFDFPATFDEDRLADHGADYGKRVDPFDDDEPIEVCDLENPEVCESCQ